MQIRDAQMYLLFKYTETETYQVLKWEYQTHKLFLPTFTNSINPRSLSVLEGDT
jgi:hypothetical protein